MIRTVNFRDDVLFPALHLLGIDPELDFNKDHARAIGSFINSRVRYAWEIWEWPELNITEERAFRTVWNVAQQFTRQGIQGQGPDELYYLPNQTYYQVLATAPSDPPLGTTPDNATYFQPLNPLTTYVAYDQIGKQSIGQVFGIHASDPGVSNTFIRGDGYTLSERGIELAGVGTNTVWLTYQVRPSKFSTDLYTSAKAYLQGNVVLWTDGQCYRAIANITGHTPADTGYWAMVPMPYTLSEYVKTAAASDAAEDPQLKQSLAGQAEDLIGREIDKLTAQGQPLARYKIGQSRGRGIPYGILAWSNSIPA